MTKHTVWFASGLLALLTMGPPRASAQTTGDQTLSACYIPLVGVVYRIKAPGLPSQCLHRTHVEFQWNAQGPKGDRGEAGPAGNLALAGQNCPPGFFVTGFNATGGLVCRNTAGDEPTPPPPPPPPPHPFAGTWTLSPTLTSTCATSLFSVAVVVNGLRTTVSANVLSTTPTGFFSVGGSATPFSVPPVVVAITDPPTFPVGFSLQATSPLTGPLSGSATYDIVGQFSSLTSVTAVIDITLSNVSISGFAATCTRMTGTVTGTRVP